MWCINVVHQFGFVEAIPTQSKFFMSNTAHRRPPTKSATEADRLSAMGNCLQCFFTLVGFWPNHMGWPISNSQGLGNIFVRIFSPRPCLTLSTKFFIQKVFYLFLQFSFVFLSIFNFFYLFLSRFYG